MIKYLFYIVFTALLGMIYWSSLVREASLIKIEREIQTLQRRVEAVERRGPLSNVSAPLLSKTYADNLLKEDPYFEVTLPRQLGDNFIPHGTRKEATYAMPKDLHPMSGLSDTMHYHRLCSGSLAKLQFGKFETEAPFFAEAILERPREDDPNKTEYSVILREGLEWAPLNPAHFPPGFELHEHFLTPHPVTSYDFKLFIDAILNPFTSAEGAVALRNYYSEIEEIKIIDDRHFVVRWKGTVGEDGKWKMKYIAQGLTGGMTPLASFVYKYFQNGEKIIEDEATNAYQESALWAQNFNMHWAKQVIPSCGAYLFDGMTEEAIRFKRNPNFYDPYASLVEGYVVFFKDSVDGMWNDFKMGKTDYYKLTTQKVAEWKNFQNSKEYAAQQASHYGIKSLFFTDRLFSYIGWNQKTPFFEDTNIRIAMTMGIDRNRIIQEILNNLGVPITGPAYVDSASYDPSLQPYPYDPEASSRLLEQAGWVDNDGDGIREKTIDGKVVPFRFKLTYFVKNPTTKAIVEYIATSLKQIQIDCIPHGVDINDLVESFNGKSFEAIYFGWGLGTPPENHRQIWHSSGAKEKGSSNAIGFSNPQVDALIDALDYEYDPQKRRELYHKFHKIIHEEAPYTFLYSPKSTLLYRENVENLFIPKDRQDLIPGADVPDPQLDVIYFQ